MAERNWFPRGAGQQQLGGIDLPRCDDPPTTALALEAAQYMQAMRTAEEEAHTSG